MKSRKLLVILLAFLSIIRATAQTTPLFPLRLSENKRYLVDSNNKPFLIKEFSAWGLIQALSEKDEAAFLDSLKIKGFNTVLTSVLSNAPSQMGGNPPYWQGVSPLTVKWDFSKPNETYFQHVDRFFAMAEQKGFFVMALPVYLGYRTDPSQGWWDEIKGSQNDTLKMRQYGEFIGKRYQSTKNIMWIAGGDNNADGDLLLHEINLIRGVKTFDTTHLWSGHFDMNLGTIWSTDHPVLGKLMDIDGLYVWTESIIMERGPQYRTELAQYDKGKMIIQLDQSYEHDNPHYADNENYQWIRRKMYEGLLDGCKGTSFSSGEIGNSSFWFKNWKPLMSTTGMKQVSYCFKLFESRAWEKLVPDQTSEVILSGRGTFGELDYICAAKASDNSSYIMYISKGDRTIYLNIQKMTGKPMQLHWFNPRTGEALRIGVAETREKFGITPPSEEDWVIVFDDNSLKLPTPGLSMK
ncbi:apiosidase-like domain-containing protein [Spirosoma harenae]